MSARMSSVLITTTFGRPEGGGVVVVVGPGVVVVVGAVAWDST